MRLSCSPLPRAPSILETQVMFSAGIVPILGEKACTWKLTVWLAANRIPSAGEMMVPAHVLALEELAKLAAGQLVEAGRFHEFYFRLSDIVRRYLEGRFGIMAPEQTTEEFLREAGRNPVLSEVHKELLAGFLRAADMVKFARLQPSIGESEAAFAAKGFQFIVADFVAVDFDGAFVDVKLVAGAGQQGDALAEFFDF